jgi:hypothetical protein
MASQRLGPRHGESGQLAAEPTLPSDQSRLAVDGHGICDQPANG